MGWRTVVVSKPSKVDLKLGYMVVRDNESTIKVHISEISVLLLETTNISITTAVLAEFMRQKIAVIFCDEKLNPSAQLIPYYGCHDNSLKIRNQMEWQKESKELVWTEIVSEKIRNQAKLLEYFKLPQADKLYGYLEEIEFNDESNREGHAAKVYFNALFGKDFSRSKECPTNAALNYGYSIILSCVNREVASNGYLTQLGLFHDNMFNHFNLSCDLMEPFRPIIDGVVKNMKFNSFDKEQKREIVSVLNREFLMENKKQTLLNAIKIYVKSVIVSIESMDISEIKFFRYEL